MMWKILWMILYLMALGLAQQEERFLTGSAGGDYSLGSVLGSLLGTGGVDCGGGRNRLLGLLGSLCCVCDYSLKFYDQYGTVQGACATPDNTGQVWCYTTGEYCPDAVQSTRFPDNPWSYQACGGRG